MTGKFLAVIVACLLALTSLASHAEDAWVKFGADGQPQVQLYFFWSMSCPHCTAAHPYIEVIPQARSWVELHALELSRSPDNVRLYEAMARQLGRRAMSVPALLFCGEMYVGWDSDATTGAMVLLWHFGAIAIFSMTAAFLLNPHIPRTVCDWLAL